MIEEAQNMQIIKVSPENTGSRLDVFLASAVSGQSRAQITKLIKMGLVKGPFITLKPSQLVSCGENYQIEIPKLVNTSLTPQEIPLEILFSDEHIAVINKPQGLVVHPGAGVYENTLCHALLHYFPDMEIGNAQRPGIVHRLDKDTSGVMVIAKHQRAHQILSDAFKARCVKKIYRAFCHGLVEKKSFELITGHVRHPYNRLRFFTGLAAPKSVGGNVRLAHSSFVVCKTAAHITELLVLIKTGRTHQIRAHLSDIGHPLLGDVVYGGKKELLKSTPLALSEAVTNLNGQALHAESLEFSHPITKELMTFTAPLPQNLSVISGLLHQML